MSREPNAKPRTLREILEECRQRAHRGKAKPLPLPPEDAPPPPTPFNEADRDQGDLP